MKSIKYLLLLFFSQLNILYPINLEKRNIKEEKEKSEHKNSFKFIFNLPKVDEDSLFINIDIEKFNKNKRPTFITSKLNIKDQKLNFFIDQKDLEQKEDLIEEDILLRQISIVFSIKGKQFRGILDYYPGGKKQYTISIRKINDNFTELLNTVSKDDNPFLHKIYLFKETIL